MPALEELTLMHYRLQRRLAQGGMSEIYLAEDTRDHHLVAIKLVSNERQEFYERFQREVEAMATLNHDHILPAFDYGSYGPWYYMVMPYIEYGTLRDRLAQGPLSLKEAGILLEQIADALQFAHDHGMLHRDIKPSNILLRDGEHAYLADFGLVKHLQGESAITQAGCLVGTPEYMAPELAEDAATPQSDVYALGIVLYQMLTGQVPFKSQTPMGIYWKHLREKPVAPSQLNAAIPHRVEQVVLRALEKEPGRRYASARAFADAYHAALDPAPRFVHLSSMATLSHWSAGEVKQFFSMNNWRILGDTGRLLRSAPSSKVAAIALTALFILCLLPATLGFWLYQSQRRENVPAVSLASTVLFKAKTPPFVITITPTLLPITPVPTRNTLPTKTTSQSTTHTTPYIGTTSYHDPDHDAYKHVNNDKDRDSHPKDHDSHPKDHGRNDKNGGPHSHKR